MKRTVTRNLLAVAVLCSSAVGCTPTSVFRGQSPVAQQSPDPFPSGATTANRMVPPNSPQRVNPVGFNYAGPGGQLDSTYPGLPSHDAINNHFHGTTTNFYSGASGDGQLGASGPDCNNQPCGNGSCGRGNGTCGNGSGGGSYANGDCNPHHNYSYSYSRPNNLVYPPQNVPAGAVVYPYYTCKGPSDFFHQ